MSELQCRHDSRKSFYGKATIRYDTKTNRIILSSYGTEVAYLENYPAINCRAIVIGPWSRTTTRHIKEFLKQSGFVAESLKQIMKDYGESSGLSVVSNPKPKLTTIKAGMSLSGESA